MTIVKESQPHVRSSTPSEDKRLVRPLLAKARAVIDSHGGILPSNGAVLDSNGAVLLLNGTVLDSNGAVLLLNDPVLDSHGSHGAARFAWQVAVKAVKTKKDKAAKALLAATETKPPQRPDPYSSTARSRSRIGRIVAARSL